MSIQGVTHGVDDVNNLIEEATKLIPVVGGLVSAIVAIFAKRGQPVPQTLLEALAPFQSNIEQIKANDAAWRATHPEV